MTDRCLRCDNRVRVEELENQIQKLERHIERLHTALAAANCNWVITGNHGHVPLKQEERYDGTE